MGESATAREPILDPDLPIVDPHHHLWDRPAWRDPALPPPTHPFDVVCRRASRYLTEELAADLTSGHKVVATVFLQCGAMYRADGPEHLRPVGETEFVNGAAAVFASGFHGPVRACAGIVGGADFTRASREVAELLDAHLSAAGPRFKGVRQTAGYSADPGLSYMSHAPEGLYRAAAFRAGFGELGRRGLSFDAWVYEPQLADVVDLARAFPDTPIVLNHLGSPLGCFSYEGRREERFPLWRASIEVLASCPNVTVKLGGLGMFVTGFPSVLADPPAPSTQLADEWRPYIETGIEAFGAERCMFESNFPPDNGCGDYATVWNAFKRLAAGCSADEKTALFSGTASRVYRLGL